MIHSDEIIVETKKAKGKKCPVCWKIKEKNLVKEHIVNKNNK